MRRAGEGPGVAVLNIEYPMCNVEGKFNFGEGHFYSVSN